jgi:hypothetical protein
MFWLKEYFCTHQSPKTEFMPGTCTKNNVGVAANYKRKNLASFAKKEVFAF